MCVCVHLRSPYTWFGEHHVAPCLLFIKHPQWTHLAVHTSSACNLDVFAPVQLLFAVKTLDLNEDQFACSYVMTRIAETSTCQQVAKDNRCFPPIQQENETRVLYGFHLKVVHVTSGHEQVLRTFCVELWSRRDMES